MLTRVRRSGRRIFVIQVRVTTTTKWSRVPVDPDWIPSVRVPVLVVSIRIAARIVRSFRVPAAANRVSLGVPVSRIYVNGISANWIPISIPSIVIDTVRHRIVVGRISISAARNAGISTSRWVSIGYGIPVVPGSVPVGIGRVRSRICSWVWVDSDTGGVSVVGISVDWVAIARGVSVRVGFRADWVPVVRRVSVRSAAVAVVVVSVVVWVAVAVAVAVCAWGIPIPIAVAVASAATT